VIRPRPASEVKSTPAHLLLSEAADVCRQVSRRGAVSARTNLALSRESARPREAAPMARGARGRTTLTPAQRDSSKTCSFEAEGAAERQEAGATKSAAADELAPAQLACPDAPVATRSCGLTRATEGFDTTRMVDSASYEDESNLSGADGEPAPPATVIRPLRSFNDGRSGSVGAADSRRPKLSRRRADAISQCALAPKPEDSARPGRSRLPDI
jgi:hypothetical protein